MSIFVTLRWMTDQQRELLTNRLEIASREQPELLVLRQKLLDVGGIEVVAPLRFDSDIPSIISDGYLMLQSVLESAMENGACHQNVAELWRQGLLSCIGTGYALSGELWRQHSWGVKDDHILETTAARLKYFGTLLEGESAGCFAANNPLD